MSGSKTKKPSRKRLNSPFAKNLKTILEERALSQRAASEIADVSVATINDWLQGAQPNDLMAVMRLCQALKCDFQWLLTGTRSQFYGDDLPLSQVFDIQNEAAFSGIFMIEAKRLIKKN